MTALKSKYAKLIDRKEFERLHPQVAQLGGQSPNITIESNSEVISHGIADSLSKKRLYNIPKSSSNRTAKVEVEKVSADELHKDFPKTNGGHIDFIALYSKIKSERIQERVQNKGRKSGSWEAFKEVNCID